MPALTFVQGINRHFAAALRCNAVQILARRRRGEPIKF